LHRAAGNLDRAAQGHGTFADPRDVDLGIVLIIHELEAA
jgi:hypothetical protein